MEKLKSKLKNGNFILVSSKPQACYRYRLSLSFRDTNSSLIKKADGNVMTVYFCREKELLYISRNRAEGMEVLKMSSKDPYINMGRKEFSDMNNAEIEEFVSPDGDVILKRKRSLTVSP